MARSGMNCYDTQPRCDLEILTDNEDKTNNKGVTAMLKWLSKWHKTESYFPKKTQSDFIFSGKQKQKNYPMEAQEEHRRKPSINLIQPQGI